MTLYSRAGHRDRIFSKIFHGANPTSKKRVLEPLLKNWRFL
jgi:hypothetical protein